MQLFQSSSSSHLFNDRLPFYQANAMPPKNKKTKAEEALAFLDDLDNLEAPPESTATPPPAASERQSIEGGSKETETTGAPGAADDEAESALAFLQAQINQKRAPLSVPTASTPRTGSPALSSSANPVPQASTSAADTNVPTSSTPTSGWGMGSLWSSAATALQSAQRVAESAQRVADEQYRKVREEGVSSVRGQLEQLNVGGVDLNKLRKDAEERIGGIVKKAGNVDLDKLRTWITHVSLIQRT